MKVILLSEVKNLGKINQVIEVSDGYAKNYLFPNNLALPATKTNMERNKQIKNQETKMAIEKIKHFQNIKKDLENINLDFKLRVKNGKVAGAISAKQIAGFLFHNFDINIDKHKFVNFKPINHVGTTDVVVRLMSNVIAKFKITVTAIEE